MVVRYDKPLEACVSDLLCPFLQERGTSTQTKAAKMEDTQESLPVELQAMILSYITEVRHLLPCLQVSKTWKEIVDSEEKWRLRTVENEWPWLLLRQHFAWEPQPSGGI